MSTEAYTYAMITLHIQHTRPFALRSCVLCLLDCMQHLADWLHSILRKRPSIDTAQSMQIWDAMLCLKTDIRLTTLIFSAYAGYGSVHQRGCSEHQSCKKCTDRSMNWMPPSFTFMFAKARGVQPLVLTASRSAPSSNSLEMTSH